MRSYARIGKERDRQIVQIVDERRYLTRSQIQRLCFHGFKDYNTASRKATERLKKLYEQRQISRSRIWDFNTQYIYYLGQRNENWKQYIWTNEIYTQLKSKLTYFKNEYVFGDIRADGLAQVQLDDKSVFYFFIEVDRGTKAPMEIKKYNDLYEQDGWLKAHWGGCGRFPRVLIITDRIEKYKSQPNKNGLKFILVTFEEVEGMKWYHKLLEG